MKEVLEGSSFFGSVHTLLESTQTPNVVHGM